MTAISFLYVAFHFHSLLLYPVFFSQSAQIGTGHAYLQEISLDISLLEDNREASSLGKPDGLCRQGQVGTHGQNLKVQIIPPHVSNIFVTPLTSNPWAWTMASQLFSLNSCVPGFTVTFWFWSSVDLTLLCVSKPSSKTQSWVPLQMFVLNLELFLRLALPVG